MAKFGNRVKETSDTTGTGTLDLNGAPTGFRGFADEFTSGDDVYYLIVDDPDNPTDYEYGIGTFTAGTPNTLSRNTVEGSSNSGNKVSFVSGTKTVVSTPTGASLAGTTIANVFTKIQKWAKGADVASASSLTLGNDGNYFDITGTTTITSIATKGVGTIVHLHFDASLTLTHHATDLILPGGANITTQAGDEAEFIEYASGDWRCTQYQRTALGKVPGELSRVAASGAAQIQFSLPAGYSKFRIELDYVYPATDAQDMHLQVSTNGGSSWVTTGYHHERVGAATSAPSTPSAGGSASDSKAVIASSANNVADNGLCGFIDLWISGASVMCVFLLVYRSSAGNFTVFSGGLRQGSGSVNAVKLFSASGNINGTARLIGTPS